MVCLLINYGLLKAQCTIASPCGYSIDVSIKPLVIVPTTTNCPFGFNYDVTFSYTITTVGTNSCYNDVIGFQPMINCNGTNSGYYSINVAAPTVGSPPVNSSVTGTLTTSTNQYSSGNDCTTATPVSLNCNSLQITIYGPGLSSTTYPCSFSTLPITLTDFLALYTDEKVILKWVTVSEKDNARFDVERSSDGVTWEVIHSQAGSGTNTVLKTYLAEDRYFLKGVNYYRLKQTDRDGRFSYSPIATTNTHMHSGSMRVFPNPFTSCFTLESDDTFTKQVAICNSLGQTVYNGTMETRLLADLSTEPSGIYFIKIKSATSEENFKLLKN